MHYFSEFSKSKRPDIDLSVSIANNSNDLTMEVSFRNEHKSEVDSLIKEYGLILNESKQPSEVLTNPGDILQLDCELRMARARIETQTEIIASSAGQIKDLKRDISWLKKQVSHGFLSKDKHLEILIDLLGVRDEKASELSKQLIKGIREDDEELMSSSSEKLKSDNPESWNKIQNFLSNVVSSTGANAPAWIDYLSKIF